MSPSRAGSLPQWFQAGHKIGVHRKSNVGASPLAKGVNDDAGCLNQRVALESIASRLAPTVVSGWAKNRCSPKIKCRSEPAREGR
ncbi:hypothetical protein EKG40_01180 [Pseudomonas moorei]|nr:hypothetical protein EKG40_01180 [Pseudomonas moorei]